MKGADSVDQKKEIDFTPAQRQAIFAHGRTLLISAAAGSGKTFTLTQRIIKSILEDGIDISELLIVTYTRAAAAQLKEKIAKALTDEIAKDPQNTDLQNQLMKLGQAHISTIDSFFAEPVKANFERLGLPASLRMADDAELAPIRERIMGDTLDEFFSECEAYKNSELSSIDYRTRFTELIGITTGARDTSSVIPAFWGIYSKLITSPISVKQLQLYAGRLKEEAKNDPFLSEDGRFIKEKLYSQVKYVRSSFLKHAEDMQSDEFVCSKYYADFIEYASGCTPLLDALENGSYDDIRNAFSEFSPKPITTVKTEEKTESSAYYFTQRKKLNDSIPALYNEYLYLPANEISELLDEYAEISLVLYDILDRFDKKYMAEKKKKGICEFSDMPKYLMELLTLDGDVTKETEYAKSLRASFKEVYIDEYQDVNGIQDAIFAIIGKDHRFMVGDIKQSIYGFREAEPDIFSSYRAKFAEYNEKNDVIPADPFSGNTIFMSENFRCDKGVIDFANYLCERIFPAISSNIGYNPEGDNLKHGKKVEKDYVAKKVELMVVETPPRDENEEETDTPTPKVDSAYHESFIVANEIARLIRNEKKADGKPIKAGDIAILVRSMAHAKQLMRNLDKLNIKYAASKKGDLFEGSDMSLLVDLLSVIDNPRADMPLYNVLTAKSEIYEPEFTIEEVIKIRKNANKVNSLYDAMLEYSSIDEDDDISERCADFISRTEKLRARARGISADKLIKDLIFCERYTLLTRTEAYSYLFNSACSYVKNNWSSLYSFLTYYKKLMENSSSGSEPAAEDENAVKIMTVHQSKGLEFNVCFLFGFGKQFNINEKDSFVFIKGHGAYMKLPPKKTNDPLNDIRTRYCNNPIFKSACRRDYQRQLEEEARVFYVALTRPVERLYVSGSITKTYEEYIQKLERCADVDYELQSSNTFLYWTLLILAKSDKSAYDQFCNISVYQKGDIKLADPFTKKEIERAISKNADEYEIGLANALMAYPEGKRDREILSGIPSKVAASKLSCKMLEENVFTTLPDCKLFPENEHDIDAIFTDNKNRIRSRIELMKRAPVRFDDLIGERHESSAAQKGTAMHAFLQFCDFERLKSEGIDSEIDRLVSEKFISESIKADLNRSLLDRFIKSDIFDVISRAKSIRREFHFGMYMPAEKFTQNQTIKNIVNGKSIYVQGSIDLLIEDSDGELILCDYKTDRVTSEEHADRALLIQNVKQRHQNQLDQYSHAVTEIFGRSPKKRFIYLFNINEAIEI